MSLRVLLLAVGLVLAAVDAAAVTLGRARGAVLIGRPLELSIPATLDSADGDAPCVEGDLFHGEQRIEQRLSIRWVPGNDRQGVVRITSPVPVDEPMVTVYLRVGCAHKVMRRYVLLAELPPEQEPTTPLVANPRTLPATAPQAGGQPQAPALRSDSVPAVPSGRGGARATAPAPSTAAAPGAVARATPQAAAAPADEPAPRLSAARRMGPREAAREKATARRARLKVEPLDLLPEDPTLRISSQLRPDTTPADPKTRATAAALWQALNKPPEIAAQEAQRLQTLEQELKSLRDVTRENSLALKQMREQAEKSRSERDIASWLVFALLLLAVLGVAAFAWRRLGGGGGGTRWYSQPEADSFMDEPRAMPARPAGASAGAGAGVGPALGSDKPAARGSSGRLTTVPVPVSPQASDPSGAPSSARTELDSAFARNENDRPRDSQFDFQASQGGSIRMVRVDELIDIQDKAAFFLSIGQHEQAIAVLESHVHDQVETSAVAWLDLLELYHQLGRREDFERLRSEFRMQFNANVPEFDAFDQPTGGLEKYGRALSRIVALWPSPRVLEVIEESIFRKPGLPGADAFSLEAYRELILLYNIGKEVVPAEADDFGGRTTQFPHTEMQPLAPWAQAEAEEESTFDPLLIPPRSANVGVDIDLDEADEVDDLIPPPGSPDPAKARAEFGMLDFDTDFGTVEPEKPGRG